jgi:hypothetical protein
MHRKFPILQLLAFGLSLVPGSVTATEDAKSQIAAEISRLEQSRETTPTTDQDLASVLSAAMQNLTAASVALESDKLYLSLEKLLLAEDLLNGAAFPVAKAETVKAGYAGFEAEWRAVSQRVSTLSQESQAGIGRDPRPPCAPLLKLPWPVAARCSMAAAALPFPPSPPMACSISGKPKAKPPSRALLRHWL